MRLKFLFIIGLIVGRVVFAAEKPNAERPNMLIILADDLGFSDLGCYGSEIATPNLDRLAAGGVRFTQFYNTGRCCPSRASLLTGLHPHQAGVGDMVDEYARKMREQLASAAYTDHLSTQTPTMAEILRANGYRTGMAGKWHLGYERPHWPVDRGFERSFTVLHGAMNYWGNGVQNAAEVRELPMALDGERFVPPQEGFFATDAFTDFAVQFIKEQQNGGKPFFFYLAYNAPHWPLHALPEDIERHRGKYRDGWDAIRGRRHQRLIESGIITKETALAPRPASVPAWDTLSPEQRDDWDLRMAIYAAQIEHMDRGIGRVLEALRAQGAERNTLVIFLSDNGGAAENPRRSLPGAKLGTRESYEGYGVRGAHVSSAPMRLQKQTVHEGGIATPLIACWAGRIQPGITREVGFLPDIMATCLEIAGAEFPKTFADRGTLPPEGVSLLPALEGKPLPSRALFFEHEGHRAVRQGKWKLVARHLDPWELYDMDADRTELRDLAAAQPEKVTELTELYEKWAARAGVKPWPGKKPVPK
jgi:arylsulfatase A-like enzyme